MSILNEELASRPRKKRSPELRPLMVRVQRLVKCFRDVFLRDGEGYLISALLLVAAAFIITVAVGMLTNWQL